LTQPITGQIPSAINSRKTAKRLQPRQLAGTTTHGKRDDVEAASPVSGAEEGEEDDEVSGVAKTSSDMNRE
jgi:hypothetical protein